MIMDLVYMLSILQLLIAPSILIDTDTDSEVIGCEEEDRLCPRSLNLVIQNATEVGLSEEVECQDNETTNILDFIAQDVTEFLNTTLREELDQRLRAAYLGRSEGFPANSCREISDLSPDAPSQEYWLRNPNGDVFSVFCNMNLTCGPFNNITGWMRVANINMSNPEQDCPEGNFNLEQSGSSRYCVRNENRFGCDSSIISVHQFPYTQVCGRTTGVQIGTVDAFLDQNPTERELDSVYVDGVSLTYGFPREHIWTFAASISEVFLTCPCSVDGDIRTNNTTPDYVKDDYFCESGAATSTVGNSAFPEDILWDGEMCRGFETPCCSGNFNPPWFYRDLGGEQTSDIEMRLCIDQGTDEDVGLKALELYVL